MVGTAGSNRRYPSSILEKAEHQFVNSSEIVKLLLKTNDEEVEDLAGLY